MNINDDDFYDMTREFLIQGGNDLTESIIIEKLHAIVSELDEFISGLDTSTKAATESLKQSRALILESMVLLRSKE